MPAPNFMDIRLINPEILWSGLNSEFQGAESKQKSEIGQDRKQILEHSSKSAFLKKDLSLNTRLT